MPLWALSAGDREGGTGAAPWEGAEGGNRPRGRLRAALLPRPAPREPAGLPCRRHCLEEERDASEKREREREVEEKEVGGRAGSRWVVLDQ